MSTPLYSKLSTTECDIKMLFGHGTGSVVVPIREADVKSQALTLKHVAIKSLCHFKPDHDIPNPPQGDPHKFVERQRVLLLKVSDHTRRNKAFDILIKAEQEHPSTVKQSIIGENTWKDLELLCGTDRDPEAYIGSAVNKTQSELGKAYFLGLISRPTNDCEVLKKRQLILKLLADKTSPLFGALNEQLSGIDQDEEQLLSFWDTKMQLPGCMHSQFFKYHKKIDKICNGSAIALEINSTLHNLKKVSITATTAASTILLPLYAMSYVGELSFVHKEFLQGYANRFIGASAPLHAIMSLIPSDIAKSLNATAVGVISGLGIKSIFKWNVADFSTEAVVQNKLVSVSHFYRRMKALHAIISKSPDLKANLEHFDKLDAFMNNKELKPLFTALESRTFNANANFFFRRGNVLLAWNIIMNENTRNLFQPALMAVAEIDAYLSAANLVKEANYSRLKVCFPDYVVAKKPELALTNFWSPLVKNPIVNSIGMGAKVQVANAVVTATNGAGKSTVLKSIVTSVFLAQSLGIALCESMQLTPFGFIASSMNISDSLSAGQSGLQAQVVVVKNLIATLECMQEDAFSFMVLDELFTQTTAKEGSALALGTLSKLGKAPNNLAMIVSHDDAVMKIEAENKAFKNFKLASEAGTNKPLYKLEPGTSTQHVALEVAQAAGLSATIIQHAKKILSGSV